MTEATATRARERSRRVPAGKIATSIAVLAVASAVAAGQEWFRSVEAAVAATWLNLVLPGGATSVGPAYLVYQTPDGGVLFRITDECSVVLLIVPFLVIGAALVLHTRTSSARVIIALAVGVLALEVVNQFRFGLIAWSTQVWGLQVGYEISHRLVGSIIGIVGFAGAVILTVRMVGLKKTRVRR